ncbi:MAG: TonB-dependent receptor [Lysobacter sp.]|nr:TonB-dependent receptor [Lysobacter sp.]
MSFRFNPLFAAILAALPLCALAAEPADAPISPDGSDAATVLPKVFVEGDRASIAPARQMDGDATRARQAATSDAARLLDGLPGVSINAAGGVSGLPAIHGLGDDRLRIQVDGADITASCPNHMNPALSYVAPGDIGRITVYPGITPVSVGGDSIGGSIVVDRKPPVFAAAGSGHVLSGEIGAFYRSNGDAHGANVAATFATERFSLRYAGSVAKADNYVAGDDFKTYDFSGRAGHTLGRDEVGSSAYTTRNQTLDLAYAWGDHLLEATVGWQGMPEQGFPNQRMDLLDNRQRRFKLRYRGDFDWGRLDARVYRETLEHHMDFGADKRYWYGMATNVGNPPGSAAVSCAPIGMNCAAGMPMDTESDTTALTVDAEFKLAGDDLLRVGAEHRLYRLDDWWPPSGGMMWPGTFWNIRDGERERSAAHAEWEHHFDARWVAELGVRYERVRMDAGDAQGYNPSSNMMGSYQMRDAGLFNAANRSRSDGNLDASAIFRFAKDEHTDIAFGIARKTRSPGLYEVYPWSTWSMAAVMNNFVGDGNGYIGNLDLKPERAVTTSVTFDWHAADRAWELQATPYYTRVTDYIDAVQWDAATNAPRAVPVKGAFSVLKYANANARLYGLDVSGKLRLGDVRFGVFGLEGKLAYAKGENSISHDNLYNLMPLNARIALTHKLGGWDNALEMVGVTSKNSVSRVRNELETAGYGLVNLRVAREWDRVRLDVGVENLFDRFHALPTGGAYLGQGTTMSMNPTLPNYPQWAVAVPGPGRSIYAAVNVKF